MKQCKRCNELKPLTEYYRHKGMKDGHINYCKACKSAQEAAFWKTPQGKATKKRKDQRDRANNPKKIAARQLVNDAIRRGKISRTPCEICGSNDRLHAHHDNYNFPLSIRWLCHSCHVDWHNNNEPIDPV